MQVTVNPANIPPTANAGSNQNITLPTDSVSVSGSGTDSDGTIVSYQWTEVSGPSQYTIVSSTQAQTIINNLVQGTYQFQLTVTDNLGATGSDIVVITVNASPNKPPVANAGPNQTITLPTNTVTSSWKRQRSGRKSSFLSVDKRSLGRLNITLFHRHRHKL